LPEVAGHADFWVAVATISPIAIATNLLSLGQISVRKIALPRDQDEDSFTSWLRARHIRWVLINLAACLVLIGFALRSLWSGSDAVPGWVAIALLLAMLIELCILAVCTASIFDRFRGFQDARKVAVWVEGRRAEGVPDPAPRQLFACVRNPNDAPTYVELLTARREDNDEPRESVGLGMIPPHDSAHHALDPEKFPPDGDLPLVVIEFLDADRIWWRRDSTAGLTRLGETATAAAKQSTSFTAGGESGRGGVAGF
jgi:hypothetical protein